MIILNEREYAENCLQNGIVDTKPFVTLSILAKYYYHECGYRKKKITTLLLEYLSKHYPRYELNEFSWQTSIEKIAANAGAYQLYQINGVKITRSEMETITNLHNKVLERLMFTMLCLAKLSNEKNPNNNGWVNADAKDIFTYARIGCKSDEREVKIGKLWQMGLLEFSKRNDNLNCRVTFVDNEGDEELFVSDFRELGYEYQKYKGENFIHCAECGILTRGNKANTKKYCSNCATYTPKNDREIVCIDCGREFIISGNSKKICRCHECQDIRNKNKMSEWRKKQYYGKKVVDEISRLSEKEDIEILDLREYMKNGKHHFDAQEFEKNTREFQEYLRSCAIRVCEAFDQKMFDKLESISKEILERMGMVYSSLEDASRTFKNL